MKRNWKEDIHDRLGNFETDAPDGLWEAIHQRMAQTEPAKAEKRQTPFVLQPALRRTACAAAACLALVAGYQYFADGGKETASGVKVAQSGVADIPTNRYVAKNAVAPAATVYAQTQNSPAVTAADHPRPAVITAAAHSRSARDAICRGRYSRKRSRRGTSSIRSR